MSNNKVQIKLVVTEDEQEKIKTNAKACDKTVSAYIRETALNMCVMMTDYSVVTDHTAELSAYRNAINQLIFTIRKTGSYVPVDIEYILEKTNLMFKSEVKFLNMFSQSVTDNKKTIEKEVRKTVKQHLAKKK